MISTLKPLKSEEIMETPRWVWKQLLYVKVVGPLLSPGGPTPEHPAPVSRDQACGENFISNLTNDHSCSFRNGHKDLLDVRMNRG